MGKIVFLKELEILLETFLETLWKTFTKTFLECLVLILNLNPGHAFERVNLGYIVYNRIYILDIHHCRMISMQGSCEVWMDLFEVTFHDNYTDWGCRGHVRA